MSNYSAHNQMEGSVREYGYTVVFEPFPEGGYQVIVPAMPEICTDGDTLQEAREMARDAIRCVLEGALKANEPLPPTTPAGGKPSATIERVAVVLP